MGEKTHSNNLYDVFRLISLSGSSSPVSGGPPSQGEASKELPVNQRQKSLEVMDQSALSASRLARSPGTPSGGNVRLKERSMSMPTRPASQASTASISLAPANAGRVNRDPDTDSAYGGDSPRIERRVTDTDASRASVSNDNNILLDPDILTDHVTQVKLGKC